MENDTHLGAGENFVWMVGSEEDKTTTLALNMASESIVLLKNAEDGLSLPKNACLPHWSFREQRWLPVWWMEQGLARILWQRVPNGVSVRQGFESLVGNDLFSEWLDLGRGPGYC
ncbi:hypothetical protein JG688_00018239 [Phytophthora aleatoria]|uniref:Uncharacterized protein n=1 Tax=Phytophthora aleatoria TaxID=2496075 RepID=A0A8J5MBM7_9STRA|nr:hypothetical protein JG688_00018239 [Phytophthora aleatoria]